MKNLFIIIPIILFFILVILAYFIDNSFVQNLMFCTASAILGIIGTFLVVDNYYKNNEVIDNEKLFMNIAQSFHQLVHNVYFSIIASYIFETFDTNIEIFKNNELMVEEIDVLISKVKTYQINDYSKYKYGDNTQVQLNLTKNNLNEIKELFLYLPKTLDIYKNCFPILLDAIKYFQYFELRIINYNTMLDVDFSSIALTYLNDFNKTFIKEIKKLNNENINKIIFV